MNNGMNFNRKENLPDKVIIAGGRMDVSRAAGCTASVQIFSIQDNVWSEGKYIIRDSNLPCP